jgi:NAD(P)-dependent dehydrogenase (short-subunit alcohol dehydrogenase family)
MSTFTDRTLVVSGGSRGIGLAIALGAAKRGANVVLLAKTAEPHPKLPGTVHTAVADVEAAGGKGVAVVEILSRPASDVNGQCYIDSEVLADAGVEDLARYGGGDDPILDIFVDKP